MPFFAIHMSLNPKGFGKLACRDCNWPLEDGLLAGNRDAEGVIYHRAKCVWRFSNVELLMVTLPFTSRHIVDDGIAPHMIHRFGLGNAKATFANDHSNFSLIIDRLGKARMGEDCVTMSNNTCGTLCEDDGMGRLVCLVAGVISRRVELDSMLKIILANGENIPPTDGWKDLDRRQ